MTSESNPFQSPGLEGVRGSATSDCVVEFDYVLADSEWFALRENVKHHKNLVLRLRIVFSIGAALCLLLAILATVSPEVFVMSVPLLLASAYFLYRAVSAKSHLMKGLRKQLSAMLASRNSSGIFGHTTIRLEDEGMTAERPGGSVFWRWWAVPDLELVANEGYLLMYVSSVEAWIVPARAFATDEHFELFAANALRLWNTKKHDAILATPAD